MKRILIFVLVLTLLAIPVAADVPNTINIQGVLMDESGIPLPDGDYYVVFELWNQLAGGDRVWYEETLAHQSGSVFNAILGPGEEFYRETFSQPLYLRMIIDGDDPTDPRIPLSSVATALRAWSVDPGAAVRTLNGMTDSVTLVAGNNITITQQDTTLVIAASASAGGSDEDWVIDGDNIYHAQGRVSVGLFAPGKGENIIPAGRDQGAGKASYTDSKLALLGYNQGIYSIMMEGDDAADNRHAIFAQRQRIMDYPNHGSGFGVYETNTAITGYNDWGDSYTFGVAGYTWFDFAQTGGVLGSYHNGSVWGSLAYRDNFNTLWGIYTPNDIHSSGLTETNTLRMNNGATAGYIMTSDASGNASWQSPSSAQSDGDWTISGQDLFHSGSGTVAIGTGTPTPIYQDQDYTTMQVSGYLLSALCLDQSSSGSRWAIFNNGDNLTIGHSDSPSSYPSAVMKVSEAGTEFFAPSGDLKIQLDTFDGMNEKGEIELYGSSSTASTLRLSGRSVYDGGHVGVYDDNNQLEVTITGNYNGTHVGRIITPVLEITGGSDLSEQFDIGNTSLLAEPGMVVSIDPDHPGKLTLCEGAYNRRVAGVISGAGGVNTGMLMGQSGSEADGEHPVALVGRVYVWADASNGPIEPGDLLTSSDLPGHAMKVSDHSRAMGAVLGKAMTGLSEGQGLILTLVSLQ